MHIDELRNFLDSPDQAREHLRQWGVDDVVRGHANLKAMAESSITLDLLADICSQLAEHLPHSADAGMALNNLDRFVAASRNPLSLASLFERDRQALPILLQIFSSSQYLSDLLITDSQGYDLLRLTEGQPVTRKVLVDELVADVMALDDERSVKAALRRFKRRETIRIAYGDIVRGQSLGVVTEQISFLADAILEAAVAVAHRELQARRGVPRGPEGVAAKFVVLGMGKLGGTELNYSSDIDLICLYEHDGKTDGSRPQSNAEYFDHVVRKVVELLTERTELGQCYRVDLRLRPEGKQGPLASSREQATQYYDVLGRTWERQAYVKARPVAGDLDFGQEFLEQLQPWIYRRYLGLADITGIRALKRRIEQRTVREGADKREVKTGHGGIRDIEFVIQFLQLLNGGDLPEVRTANTLNALACLTDAGCLTQQEFSLLDRNYTFLRKIEHRLQVMLDLQTHLLPEQDAELRKLAIRMGYPPSAPGEKPVQEVFMNDYRDATQQNRKILDHLLHDAFPEETAAEPVVDLVLDPDPSAERIAEVMARYGFKDVQQAYKNLIGLTTEHIRFLSTRRCRHFLASIAPTLMRAIAGTPDPDSTLTNLEKVSDSLGGKGVLWELFSVNPPSLHLYVEICATSPFLCGILTSSPGMIDELMDSLVLNKLPTLENLRSELVELCRAAEDIDPILHSFKNAQQLRVGVRDILGKEDIVATTGALSDIAQVCLEQIVEREHERQVQKLGQPTIGEGPRQGDACELIVLAMGKFGGRELNYHSDLDVVFLYEDDGPTRPKSRSSQSTTNQHFFAEVCRRVIKRATQLGPHGRLYEVDARLRPSGKSGILSTSIPEFHRYFSTGQGQLWERQALCRARVVYGSQRATEAVQRVIEDAMYGPSFTDEDARKIFQMRMRMEESSESENLKRGYGGLVDIEFLVQAMQLRYGKEKPEIRNPNTLAALAALHKASLLSDDDYEFFCNSYRLLRSIEARLRLMHTTSRDDLPADQFDLTKLARQLGFATGKALLEECQKYTGRNRQRFEALVS